MPAKILVIDDEPDILIEMYKLFSKNGFEPKTASSPEVAMCLIKQEKFDIVYTDMKMPGMNGADVCREIKKISPGTFVVVVSGSPHAMADHQVDFIEYGGIDVFLRKPIDSEEILAVTKEILKIRQGDKPVV